MGGHQHLRAKVSSVEETVVAYKSLSLPILKEGNMHYLIRVQCA